MSPQLLASPIAPALAQLREGRPVLVYDADGREEETDLFLPAQAVTAQDVRRLRSEAGGLVFLAVDAGAARRFGLPFLQDVQAEAAARFPVLDALAPGRLPYDARSSFSLTLNHRATYTGISDRDRAHTIRRFAELAAETAELGPEEARAALGAEFRSPGHVHLCVASEPLLEARRGHTELGVALARMAGITPILVGAEMLDPEGDGALPRRAAETWAKRRGAAMLDGDAIASAWATFISKPRHGSG